TSSAYRPSRVRHLRALRRKLNLTEEELAARFTSRWELFAIGSRARVPSRPQSHLLWRRSLTREPDHELVELRFHQWRRQVFQSDGVGGDGLQPDDLVGVERLPGIKLVAGALRLGEADAEPVGIDLEHGIAGIKGAGRFTISPHKPLQDLAASRKRLQV